MIKRLPLWRHLPGLLLLAAVIACSGCAMNEGYSPISGPSPASGGFTGG